MASVAASSPRVLVIEDEADLRAVTIEFLRIDGIEASGAANLDEAGRWLAVHACDVLVLDLGLPDGDALVWLAGHPDLLRLGVVITTARGDSADRVSGAKAGADAYLVKPVALEELASLIRNLCRRLAPTTIDAWSLDAMTWSLRAPTGAAVKLTRAECLLLLELGSQASQAVARNQLIRAIGHDPSYYDARRMEAMVRRLRAKVVDSTSTTLPLETVHGFGFAFTAPIELRGREGTGRPR